MTIKEALKPEQAENLKAIGRYDTVVADEVERSIDELLTYTVHSCIMPAVYCPYCEDKDVCSVRVKKCPL